MKTKTRYDKILVVDVEATCWDGKSPQGQYNDITEVGIAVLDLKTMEITQPIRELLVKPTTSEISDFCEGLTGITQEMVDERGVTFKDACKHIRDMKSREYVWCSWGEYDRKQFERQCAREDVSFPWGRTHFNTKSEFARYMRLDRELGVPQALELIGESFDGSHHRGNDDALNIAKLLRHIMCQDYTKYQGR